MSIKKNIFAPWSKGLGATRRAAMLLLVMMLTATTAWATDKTLSGSESYTAQNGDVLTGSTSGTVTIAADAKITLSGVTITGGIVCAETAEITLVGTNSVSGATNKAGIQIGGSGTTLTIRGDGSLTANGGAQSAGIGLSRAWNPANDVIGGDIVIEGGNITANGGSQWGAGIGTGVIYGDGSAKTARIGNITIKGGTVKATGGTSADGIGTGYTYTLCTNAIGTVTIYDDIDKVDASSIKNFASVVYKQGETDVTANASTYFTITEDGDRRVIVPKDNTDYTITIADGIEHGTLTGAATAKYMEKVTITATPALGYRFSRLVVRDAQNNDVASTDNSFFMPKSNVTVSAVFEQGVHGTTEFAWGYYEHGFVKEATIYDGVTTVNIQNTGQNEHTGTSYHIQKYEGDTYFRLDNNEDGQAIPFTGTGEFAQNQNPTQFYVTDDNELGFYDITMTDVGNGKWSVSILKTVGVIDNIPDQTYTGSEITPEPLVMAGSLNLTKGTHYEYSYMNNTDEGTQAKVTVNFLGDYAGLGSVERTFNIICEHTITYDLAGGTVATENPTTYTIVSGDITLTTPTREGYTFTGWTGTDLTEPTMIVTIASGSTGDRQYTATWTMTWANVKAALQAGQSVTLANDVTRVNSECIEPSGTVTLDLNGYTIDGGTTQTNPLFKIGDGVSLTITDSQTGGNLCNAGTNPTVSVDGGTLTLAAGTINAQASGVIMWGGIFNMTGGTITGGSSNGVYLNGDNVTFTMSGGTITGNETGVEISHNPSDNKVPTFTVSGNVNITGNTDEDVNMYYDYQSSTLNPIHIGGTLASTARIGVYTDCSVGDNEAKAFTVGLKGRGTRENFNLKTSQAIVLVNLEDGEMAVAKPYTLSVPDNVTVNELTEASSNTYTVGYGDHITLTYGGSVVSDFSAHYTVPNGAITYLGAVDAQGKCAEFTMPGSDMTITRAADNNYSFGGITLKETFINGNSQGLDATFDGSSQVTIDIPENIAVNSVDYNRTFTTGKPSTVMLPFSFGEGQTLTGGTLYKFSGVTKNETTGKWEATMTETTTLQANTPYLLLPDENLTDGKVTFNLNNSTVILKTNGGGNRVTADPGSHWTFKGTYKYMKWTTDTSDPNYNSEREAEIGRVYGFAGVAKTGIEVGDFVKAKSGARIRPMTCYLMWNDTPNNTRSMTRGTIDELPSSIVVRLLSNVGPGNQDDDDNQGGTTAIGTLDTETGEIDFGGWYDMSGRKLSAKPTQKGLYIHNGKKVIIK